MDRVEARLSIDDTYDNFLFFILAWTRNGWIGARDLKSFDLEFSRMKSVINYVSECR